MEDIFDFWNLFIFGAKNGLNVRELKCVLWRYGCGKKLREIAELEGEGKSKQSVQQLLNKICKKMRKRLGRR